MTCSFADGGVPAMRSAPAASILRFLVVGYVALLPYLFEVGPRLNFAPADCLLVLVLVLAAAHLKLRRSAWTIWHGGILLTFALGSLVAAVGFGELDRYELLNKDAGLLLPFLSYAAITSVVTDWEDLRHILRVFTVSVVVENLLAIGGFLAAYFFHVATPFTRYEGLRLSGMLLDPNAYGGLLVVALVICEGASWGQTPLFQRPMLWFSRITLDLGILFTFSRSAWLGLGCGLLAFLRDQARGCGSTFAGCYSRQSLCGLPDGTSVLARFGRNGQPSKTGAAAVRSHSPGPTGIRTPSAARRRTRKLSVSGWRSCTQQRDVVSG